MTEVVRYVQITSPGYVPGRFWTHRIDAIPEIGRKVRISCKGGMLCDADVVDAWDMAYTGIGCEVGYITSCGQPVAARNVEHWKYL